MDTSNDLVAEPLTIIKQGISTKLQTFFGEILIIKCVLQMIRPSGFTVNFVLCHLLYTVNTNNTHSGTLT